MAQQTITVAACTTAGDATGRWWLPVVAAWPRVGQAPQPRYVPLAELIPQIMSAQTLEILDPLSPMLLILGPEVSGSALFQLVDHLQQLMVPAVLLFPSAEGPMRQLESDGIIIDSWDCSPTQIAAFLFTLSQRQVSIRSLTRDLSISNRYQGGVRGEIDRIHDELNLAAAVQQEMLPRQMPETPGIQFGTLFRPAGYVSGDIYDVVQLDDRTIGFFIADAVGHGVPAALMTMVISRSLRMTRMGEQGREIITPGEAMTRLNEELCRGRKESPRFSTAVYGVIDTLTRRVSLSGAGHPPPLRIRGSFMTKVNTDGPLLGVFPGEKYDEATFILGDDETLLLYSDGFETAFAPPETHPHRRKAADSYLGELSRLHWPAAAHRGTAADALRELEDRIDAQSGSLHQVDDVTALAISARSVAAQNTTIRQAA
jgi:serine phosphatase RsbU (regulator of sigma subunit)